MMWLWRLWKRVGYEHEQCDSCDGWDMNWEHGNQGAFVYCSICGPLIRRANRDG